VRISCVERFLNFERVVQVVSDNLYALKIVPMTMDDWLGTWASRLRLLPMFQHPNVLRYFPSEWHRRGGKNRRTVSYSAVYLTMEFCNMGRLCLANALPPPVSQTCVLLQLGGG
jgi:hypothetical protein